MSELGTKLEARLRAIEFLLVNLYGIENRRRGWDAERVLQEHKDLLDRMHQQHRSAPVDSTLSNEIYATVERLLSQIRAMS